MQSLIVTNFYLQYIQMFILNTVERIQGFTKKCIHKLFHVPVSSVPSESFQWEFCPNYLYRKLGGNGTDMYPSKGKEIVFLNEDPKAWEKGHQRGTERATPFQIELAEKLFSLTRTGENQPRIENVYNDESLISYVEFCPIKGLCIGSSRRISWERLMPIVEEVIISMYENAPRFVSVSENEWHRYNESFKLRK